MSFEKDRSNARREYLEAPLSAPLPATDLTDTARWRESSLSELEPALTLARERLRKQSPLRFRLRHLLSRLARLAMRMERHLDN